MAVRSRFGFPSQLFSSLQVLLFFFFLFVILNSQKKKVHLCRLAKEKKSLAQLLRSSTFHCKSNRHPLGSPFPDHNYGFGYSSRSVPFLFVFQGNAHCSTGEYLRQVQEKKIHPNMTLGYSIIQYF